MIIWSGLGFLVPLLTFGACVLLNLVLDAQYGQGFYSAHEWTAGSGLILGGLISLGAGLALRPRAKPELASTLAPQTAPRSRHTFFFVPMHWAGLIIAIIGVGVVVHDIVK
jgi:hypothetical protein